MKISLSSLFVEDQEAALSFYTNTLGFTKKQDVPAGDHRWLTVVSPEEPDGTELVLEPCLHPAARAFQQAMYEDGIPLTAFEVDDLTEAHARLVARGVSFHTEPTDVGAVMFAVFDDTCGNLVQIYQMP